MAVRGRPEHRRGPSRATIILGAASFSGGSGFVVGSVAMFFRAQTFPDYARFAMTTGLIGAGIGWLLGALAGANISAGCRRVGSHGAVLLWLAAAAAVATGAWIALLQREMAATWFLVEQELPWLQWFTVTDALLVAGTLLLASILGSTDAGVPKVGPTGHALSIVGIVLLASMFVITVNQVHGDHRRRLASQQGLPASKTLFSLLRSASAFHDRHGRFPADEAAVLETGGAVTPGSKVAFAGPVGNVFCVIVGIDDGDGSPGEPVYTGIIRTNARGVATSPRRVASCDKAK